MRHIPLTASESLLGDLAGNSFAGAVVIAMLVAVFLCGPSLALVEGGSPDLVELDALLEVLASPDR